VDTELLSPSISGFLKKYTNDDSSEMEAYSVINKIPFTGRMTGDFLSFMVKLLKPCMLLEIGTGIGFSTKKMCISTDCKIISIDSNRQRVEVAKDFLKEHRQVELQHVKAQHFLKETDHKFDFVFVDSTKNFYPLVWNYLKNRLMDKAIVIFDDIFLYGLVSYEDAEIPYKYKEQTKNLRLFIDEIMYDEELNSTILPIGNGLLLVNYSCKS